jgi:predicted TPR repeat methyltransferase
MAKKQKSQVAGKTPDELMRRAYGLNEGAEARRLYRDWAETYDAHLETDLGYILPGIVADHFAGIITKSAGRAGRVLDIGCGTGLVGQSLSGHGFSQIDGLDFSPEMLAQARAKEVYGTLIEADLTTTLDIETATYVAAICTGTFTEGHVSADAFDEIFRILTPGGLFVASINMEIWKEGGFGPKIDALTQADVMQVINITPTRAFKGGEEHFQILVMRKGP